MPDNLSIQNNIIKGEASESDSEDEQYAVDAMKNSGPKSNKQLPHGTVVDGEAPESDDEIANFQIPVNHENHSNTPRHNRYENTDSLLIKKLADCNFSLWNHLNSMVQGTALSASKQILATDQLLLKSQVTLQTTSNSIKKINENTSQILDKYRYIISENFIPDIKI